MKKVVTALFIAAGLAACGSEEKAAKAEVEQPAVQSQEITIPPAPLNQPQVPEQPNQ